MNTEKLLEVLRSMAGSLSQVQVDSVNAILESCKKHGVTDLRQIAYIFATAYHEARLKPIEEIGKGKGLPYGGKLDMGSGPGKRVAYTTPDKLFYGRGLIQITWLANYKAFSKLLNVDLVNHPELTLQTDIAAEIIVIGMQKGMFTGKNLSDYFDGTKEMALGARRIVNGNDKAELIADYYNKIYSALKS